MYNYLLSCIHYYAMWQLRFNNKMQSSLDRLNLGPGLAKNKTKGKEDKREKKANKKGEESYKTGA